MGNWLDGVSKIIVCAWVSSASHVSTHAKFDISNWLGGDCEIITVASYVLGMHGNLQELERSMKVQRKRLAFQN